jgi:hypothetical protein
MWRVVRTRQPIREAVEAAERFAQSGSSRCPPLRNRTEPREPRAPAKRVPVVGIILAAAINLGASVVLPAALIGDGPAG